MPAAAARTARAGLDPSQHECQWNQHPNLDLHQDLGKW